MAQSETDVWHVTLCAPHILELPQPRYPLLGHTTVMQSTALNSSTSPLPLVAAGPRCGQECQSRHLPYISDTPIGTNQVTRHKSPARSAYVIHRGLTRRNTPATCPQNVLNLNPRLLTKSHLSQTPSPLSSTRYTHAALQPLDASIPRPATTKVTRLALSTVVIVLIFLTSPTIFLDWCLNVF